MGFDLSKPVGIEVLVKFVNGPYDGHEQEADTRWDSSRLIVQGAVYQRIPCSIPREIITFDYVGPWKPRHANSRNPWTRRAKLAWKLNAKVNAFAGFLSYRLNWHRPFFIRWSNWLLALIWSPEYQKTHATRK